MTGPKSEKCYLSSNHNADSYLVEFSERTESYTITNLSRVTFLSVIFCSKQEIERL